MLLQVCWLKVATVVSYCRGLTFGCACIQCVMISTTPSLHLSCYLFMITIPILRIILIIVVFIRITPIIILTIILKPLSVSSPSSLSNYHQTTTKLSPSSLSNWRELMGVVVAAFDGWVEKHKWTLLFVPYFYRICTVFVCTCI